MLQKSIVLFLSPRLGEGLRATLLYVLDWLKLIRNQAYACKTYIPDKAAPNKLDVISPLLFFT